MAAAYEARGSAAASSATSALAGAKQFPLPAVAQQAQTAVESLLASLDEAPRLLAEMTQAFRERAERSARGYEDTEAENTRLTGSIVADQS